MCFIQFQNFIAKRLQSMHLAFAFGFTNAKVFIFLWIIVVCIGHSGLHRVVLGVKKCGKAQKSEKAYYIRDGG